MSTKPASTTAQHHSRRAFIRNCAAAAALPLLAGTGIAPASLRAATRTAPAPAAPAAPETLPNRWTVERANRWYDSLGGWLTGFNYIPSDAINYTAMWDKTSFNPTLIDKELALGKSLGFNCLRFTFQYIVYADDPEYFFATFDKFLDICEKHGFRVMPCFFDDCVFGANTDPVLGKQPEPLLGWYSWAWSPSPGHSMVMDPRQHPLLEKYVKAILKRYGADKRVLLWDLYNEPTNHTGARSMVLVKKTFAWAREVNPEQPLTIGVWNGNATLNKFTTENSDIISFHAYNTKDATRKKIADLRKYNRPLICSEWMNRTVKSTYEDVGPLLKAERVGSFAWGLVNGKTQTHLSWGHRPEKLPYKGVWQHDIFHSDFTPYRESEVEFIKKLNAK